MNWAGTEPDFSEKPGFVEFGEPDFLEAEPPEPPPPEPPVAGVRGGFWSVP